MAFSNGNSNGPMADINVTPLVDVMLVLLIIFIITAPLMSHKVKVELPQANLVNKNNEEKRSNPITLAVKEDGCFIGTIYKSAKVNWNSVFRLPRNKLHNLLSTYVVIAPLR